MPAKRKGKSQDKKKTRFKQQHPEGRKVYSHRRRGHDCHWANGEK